MKNDLFLSFDKKYLNPTSVLRGWRLVDLGDLKAGEHLLETNLPAGVITENFITSPFWVVESNENGSTLFDSSQYNNFSFNKINPSHYQVKIPEGKEPFLLILSETYHREWQIKYDNKVINENHVMINGFANGWYLDRAKFQNTGETIIDIQYRPQTFSTAGDIISLSVIVFLFCKMVIAGIKILKTNDKT